ERASRRIGSLVSFSGSRVPFMSLTDHLRPSISNGQPIEQAMIRRWWHEEHSARGRLVWEYHLEGRFLDAVWFPDATDGAGEATGLRAAATHPIGGQPVVLCEAKVELTPELIGQALVYRVFAQRAGAEVRSTVLFVQTSVPALETAARELGLEV